MKFALFCLVFFLSGTTLVSQTKFPVKVYHISDGDTFWAKDESGEKIKFRPIGFDCPEESNFGKPAEPFNEEATAYTTSMIMGKTIYVSYDIDKTDQWGRHLVYVWLEDGRLFNEEILKAGWAEIATYPPNVKYVERFRKAYREGRTQQKGVFKD